MELATGTTYYFSQSFAFLAGVQIGIGHLVQKISLVTCCLPVRAVTAVSYSENVEPGTDVSLYILLNELE